MKHILKKMSYHTMTTLNNYNYSGMTIVNSFFTQWLFEKSEVTNGHWVIEDTYICRYFEAQETKNRCIIHTITFKNCSIAGAFIYTRNTEVKNLIFDNLSFTDEDWAELNLEVTSNLYEVRFKNMIIRHDDFLSDVFKDSFESRGLTKIIFENCEIRNSGSRKSYRWLQGLKEHRVDYRNCELIPV